MYMQKHLRQVNTEQLQHNLVASQIINPFPPRAAKSGHFVILLCLTPDG